MHHFEIFSPFTVVLALYILVINIVTFRAYAADKNSARSHNRRTRESSLIFMALCGGAIGAWVAMYEFRHKTRHLKFKYLIPALGILWIFIIVMTFLSVLHS